MVGRLAFILTLLLLAAPGAAQNLPRDSQDRAQQGTRESRSVQAAAEASRSLPALTGRDVSFAEILANPDDVELNYLFALTQLRANNLRGATATLARILLVNQDLPRVRLLYAITLYRVDALVEAELEFRAVAALDMPDSLRREVDAYLKEIEQRKRTTRFALGLSVGTEYDSNRNAGTDSGRFLVLGQPMTLPPDSQAQDDFAFLASLEADVVHDLESQSGHQIFASLDWYTQTQGDLSYLNLMALSLEAGGIAPTPWLVLRPAVHFGLTTLGQDVYQKRYGGSLDARRRFFENRVEVFANLLFEYQDFENIAHNGTSSEYTGSFLDARGGLSIPIGSYQRATLSGAYVSK